MSFLLRRGLNFTRVRPLGSALRLIGGDDLHLEGRLLLFGAGRVVLGRNVRLLGDRAPIEFRTHEQGELRIGDGVVIEAGVSIESTLLVELGAGARLGAFCKLLDNNFHRPTGNRHERPPSMPVSIGAGALIGPRTVLLPGAQIGSHALVGPNLVVSSRVPPGRPREQAA